MKTLLDRVQSAYQKCASDLLDQRNPQGHWTGELSTSCLSTATAVSAISLFLKNLPEDSPWTKSELEALVFRGANYLLQNANPDHGWGDTDKSFSNVATTFLGWASLTIARDVLDRKESTLSESKKADFLKEIDETIPKVRSRIDQFGGVPALKKRYGKDKTFVVPILTNCALAGLADWKDFSALPFEMSVLPQRWYRFFNMAVVSYAIPALVAIGQAHFFHRRPIPPLSWIRKAAINPSMKVLLGMQPASGGFLEAAPLTSFVAMSLAATGRSNHQVTKNCIRFLIDGVLEDGSWPIDTNLATWVTTQSMVALSNIGVPAADTETGEKSGTESKSLPSLADLSEDCWNWVRGCQYTQPHPATGADPGGWGWTDLSGSVPDADDTPGALLALFSARQLTEQGLLRLDKKEIDRQAEKGVAWLAGLQNRDGGWPTFCKGWGRLPFDKSGSDLTAHALRAINTWWPYLSKDFLQKHYPFSKGVRTARRLEEGVDYLIRTQRKDGSWLPLWFGNQDLPDDENPVYGTSKSLLCLLQFYGSAASVSDFAETNQSFLKGQLEAPAAAIRKGVRWLLDHQNSDGGWGGGPSLSEYVKKTFESGNQWFSSVEETALAVDALAAARGFLSGEEEKRHYWGEGGWDLEEFDQTLERGLHWMCDRIDADQHTLSWPIGFYFAKLWYHERAVPANFHDFGFGKKFQSFE